MVSAGLVMVGYIQLGDLFFVPVVKKFQFCNLIVGATKNRPFIDGPSFFLIEKTFSAAKFGCF